MNGCSDNILAAVSPGQIRVLLDILHNSTWRSYSFVESRFRERARNFLETLTFLRQLGWLHVEGTALCIVNTWTIPAALDDSEDATASFLDALLDSPGPHQETFSRFLSQFQGKDAAVVCPALGEFSSIDVPARNFLMELGAVRYDSSHKQYVLQQPFFSAYTWALARQGYKTQAELIEDMDKRHRLGYQAEIAILAFEYQRLGIQWTKYIRHVSKYYTTSPYDIKSLTISSERPVSRYIEVKAVSAGEPMFYWSAAEIEVARLLQSKYFLYLIPVKGLDGFDINKLQIIVNPYAVFYSQPSTWEKTPTCFLCRPAKI